MLPITALVFGDWKIPVPKPNRANLHATSIEPAEGCNRLIKRRDRAHRAAPRQAGSLVPIRSEMAPLKGATAMTANGKAVITRPKWSGG